MVGNDVVDLRDRDADIASYRAGFDARVFSEAERHAIGRGELGEATRWQRWAAKEASYKAAKQSDPRTIFSPRAFEVFCEKRWTEAVVPVQHASGMFVAVLEPARERVHAVAARSARRAGRGRRARRARMARASRGRTRGLLVCWCG